MASSNFNSLIRLYGEEVSEKIKSCEINFMNSVNKHSRNCTEKTDAFKASAKELLIASTEEAHEDLKSFILSDVKAYEDVKSFISSDVKAYEDVKSFISSDEKLKHLLTSW